MISQEKRDQALFDQIAAHYARKDIVASSALARRGQLLSAMEPTLRQSPRLGTIVDIGCGVGAPAAYLAGHYDRYIGIDQSVEMIAAARVFNRDQAGAEFIADNVKTAVLPDNTADLILSVGALHHMTELNEVMAHLVQIARPGARFVVIEPQNGNPIIQRLRWLRGKIDKGYSTDQIFFSRQELAALFQRHGITRLAVAYQGYLSPPFAQVIINPQALSAPLSRLSVRIDNWLHQYLPGPLKKLSFNIVLTGGFPEQKQNLP